MLALAVSYNLAPLDRKLAAVQDWKRHLIQPVGVLGVDFCRFMQDRHLSGGTTEDRLARRSSNLFNSIFQEPIEEEGRLVLHIGFDSASQAYAPVHEYGSAHTPARMNLRNEAEAWKPRFREVLDAGMAALMKG